MSILHEHFQRRVRDTPNRLALWSRGEGARLSFQELSGRIEAWVDALRSHGPEPVAVATGNRVAFPALVLALRKLGIPVVAMDGTLPGAEKARLCRRLGIRHLLHADEADGTVVGPGVARLRFSDVEPVAPPAACALVKLTSGSTGDPVGICLDEESLVHGIRQIGAGMEIGESDRVLVAIPLSHSYGFDNGVLSLAVLGTPLILEPRYFPGPLLQALREGEATVFPTVPPLVRALAGTPWPEDLPLRRVICAGGPLSADCADAFHRRSGYRVHQFYGSTETGGIAFERSPEDREARGTVGHPLPGVEVTLGEDHRVRVASEANFGAYLGVDCELSERMVTTGDTAAWTPDGRLRLTGRASDLFNVGGRRISALAVEQAMSRVPGIHDVAVVGVADVARGDRMVAFVVADSSSLDLTAVPRHLCPREIRRIDRLPYTDRGKLDRRTLQTLAGDDA